MVQPSGVLLLGVVAAFGMASGISETKTNSIKEAALPILSQCEQELNISREAVIEALKSRNPDLLNPCFYACFFKKIGTINEQGLYDPAVIKQLHQKYVQSDLTTLGSILDTCERVNSQPVSDGSKGCERANLLVHCLVVNQADLSLIGA